MPFKSEKQRKWMHANDPEMAKKWENEGGKLKREKYMKIRELIKKLVREELSETSKRDYKDEYKKFQSSTKSKKYRAELNKYNRDKGTYGNGDGKDASHKGGKIAGFEKESINRGRREKSRLKKEGKLKEFTSKTDTLRKKIEVVMGTLTKRLGIKSTVKNLSGKGGMSFFLDDPKEAKKLKKELDKRMKDVKIIDLDKESGDESNHVVYARLFEGKLNEAKESIFDVAARVMKDQQNYNYKSKKGMVKLDMQTANLLTQVFKKVNPKMKKYLSKMGEDDPARMVQTLRAVAK
jgi:hypothetical protein